MKQKRFANNVTRERFEEVIEKYGMKLLFAAEKSGIEYNTLCKWRKNVFNLKEDKLSKIDRFISKYRQ